MITLILGGVRSGKSTVAERVASLSGAPVTYVATGRVDLGDDDFAARVEAHKVRRPAEWATVEVEDDLPGTLRRIEGIALVDSLTTWVSASDVDVAALIAALQERSGPTILVSDEVGLGGIAMTKEGRDFADELGNVNRGIGDIADEVLLVIAGRVLPLEQR